MATVYLAHDIKHDRDVAIKVLHTDLGAALGADRFLSEIRTAARLQHPHILPLDPVTKYRKSVPPNVAAAVAKSLEKPPADRFESAKAFAEALGNTAFPTFRSPARRPR
jgi:hypothetical protein